MSVGQEASLSFEELLETSRLSQPYLTLDEENSLMKKIILVWGLPGPQASSVATALVGRFGKPSCAIRLKTSKKCANRGFVQKFGNNSAFW